MLLFVGYVEHPSSNGAKNGSYVVDDGKEIDGKLGESSTLFDDDVAGGGIVVDVDRDGGDEESYDMMILKYPETFLFLQLEL